MPLVAPRTSMTYGPGGPGVRLCASTRDPRSTPASPSHAARRPERINYLPFDFRRSAQYFRIRSETALRPAADIFLRRRRPPALADLRDRTTPPAPEQLRELGADVRLLLLQLFEPRNRAQSGQTPELLRIQIRHQVPPVNDERAGHPKHPFSIISWRARRQPVLARSIDALMKPDARTLLTNSSIAFSFAPAPFSTTKR